MGTKISINELNKSFGTKQVLCGVNLDVYEGETLCVIGRSGSGKSVILRHLIGLLSPDSGTISVDGERTDNMGKDARTLINSRFGVLFQGAALFDFMNVYDNVIFGLKRKGISDPEAGSIALQIMEKLGLKDLKSKMPHELSGGMQKRVGLARALVLNPEIMLYDEPTTGVDPITASSVNAMIVESAQERNITSVVITHDMKSVSAVADRVAMLYEGKIIFTGTPSELMSTEDPLLRQFIEGRSDGEFKF